MITKIYKSSMPCLLVRVPSAAQGKNKTKIQVNGTAAIQSLKNTLTLKLTPNNLESSKAKKKRKRI
jgi:hypothetical protein